MNDWFDPLGLRRVGDAMSTGLAQTLVGRQVQLDHRGINAEIAAVHRVEASSSFSAAFAAELALWRRLDIEFGALEIDGNSIDRLRVDAHDVRASDAMPQRLHARDLTITATLLAHETMAWIDEIAPDDVEVRVESGQLYARVPAFARFGEAELDLFFVERTVGVSVRRARVRNRSVSIPERFHQTHEQTLEWLPPSTRIESIDVRDDGGVTVQASIERYEIEVDVPALLAALAARGRSDAIDIVTRR